MSSNLTGIPEGSDWFTLAETVRSLVEQVQVMNGDRGRTLDRVATLADLVRLRVLEANVDANWDVNSLRISSSLANTVAGYADKSVFWVMDSSAVWSPGTPQDVVVTFSNGSEVLGTHTVRGALNTSTGAITVTSQATTGDTSSLTVANDVTRSPQVTVEHLSGVKVPVTFLAVESGTPGADGADGSDGAPGVDGQDGVIPPGIVFGGRLTSVEVQPNLDFAGNEQNGTIRITAGALLNPDKTFRTVTGSEVYTPFSGATVPPTTGGVFYLLWGVTSPVTRFGGVTASWGSSGAVSAGLFGAYYFGGQWSAIDATGATYNFTPLDTDVAMAAGFKVATTGGIDSMTQLTPYTGLLGMFDEVPAGLLADNAVDTQHIVSEAITAALLAAEAVTSAKLAINAVLSDHIANSAVIQGKLAIDAVTSVNISDNAITSPHISANAITAGKIAADAIDANAIQAGAITAGKLAAFAVLAENIAANAVTAEKIAAGTVTATHIASNTITAAQIAAGAIQAGEIAANAVTASKIAAGAVSAEKIAVSELAAISANMGTITAGSISAGLLAAGLISADIGISTGSLEVSSTGRIFSGKSGFNTAAAGFFLGMHSGLAKFIIGNAARTREFGYDGTNVFLKGGTIIGSSFFSLQNRTIARSSTISNISHGVGFGFAADGASPAHPSGIIERFTGVSAGSDWNSDYAWLLGDDPSDYEAFVDIITQSGMSSQGTFDTWIDLATHVGALRWSFWKSAASTATATVTLTVRKKADTTVTHTATYNLTHTHV